MPEVLLMFVVAFIALTFFSFIARRKQSNANASMVQSLEPGTEVMTSTGFLGYVVEVSEDIVVLESEPGGARTRWIPPAIVRQVHRGELIDNYPPDFEGDEDKR